MLIEVPEYLVIGIVGFSGALEIFAVMYIMGNGHNVFFELALALSGILLIVGVLASESWIPDDTS